MPQIHPTAIIAPGARIADDVVIGPYCVVGEHVALATGVSLKSHVVVEGRTIVGERTRIFPFASIGHEPQDLKYGGEASSLEIGHDNTIREHVTMHRGTLAGGGETRVGNMNYFMIGVHLGHDVRVGNGCTHEVSATGESSHPGMDDGW